VLSGRGLCDELITRQEESYRLWCVVVCDLETSGIGAPYIYDISHLRVNYDNNQQDVPYRLIYYSRSALHVSSVVFAHYQEHLTVCKVSGSVHPSCFRLVS
jgi:hypothetical protein